MKIKFLLLGTSLSLIPSLTFAQCVATQDCATLGYTETSCNGGKGVKCPFGNLWACLPTKESICKEEGFTLACNETGQIGGGDSCNGLYKQCSCDSSYKYTCTGTGYSGGVGSACNGKYTSCTCASEYEWKDGSCKISCTNLSNGAYSNVYCCNGVVVGVKASSMNFYVAMKDLGVMDWINAYNQCSIYTFCDNVKGTLPTVDQLLSIYSNKLRINTLLSTNGGTEMTESYYWSSIRYGSDRYCIVNMSDGNNICSYGYGSTTRPVLTSW